MLKRLGETACSILFITSITSAIIAFLLPLQVKAQGIGFSEMDYLNQEGYAFCTLLNQNSSDPEFVLQAMALAGIDYEERGLTTDGIRLAVELASAAVLNLCPDQSYNWLNVQAYASELSRLQPMTRPGYSRPQSPQPFATGVLSATPGSHINVRDRAGMDAPVRHQGDPGDRVTVWESSIVEGAIWYKVAFYGSNVVGWVRGDLLILE